MTEVLEKRGIYAVDFQCVQLDRDVSIQGVKAWNSLDAENQALGLLSTQFNWQCVGVDRTGDCA